MSRCWLDFEECESRWASPEPAEVERGIRAYAGKFLADCEASWVFDKRQKLAAGLVHALRNWANAAGGAATATSQELFDRAIHLEPGHEALYFEYMRLLMRTGQSVVAQDVYRRCVGDLRRHFDCAPSAATVRLADEARG